MATCVKCGDEVTYDEISERWFGEGKANHEHKPLTWDQMNDEEKRQTVKGIVKRNTRVI